MKIILFDIETAPILGMFWQLYKPYLTHENILKDGSILTAVWKELDRPACGQIAVDPENPRDDKQLVHALAGALGEADVLVGHNLDKFDVPWVQSRLLYHGLEPLPPIRTIDTLKVARKKFRFSANRLDYLGEYLGCGRKIKTDYELWKQVLDGDPSALRKMLKYNKQDVFLLEEIYKKLRPYMTNHPNLRLMSYEALDKCPTCGVGELECRGKRYTARTVYQRYHCLNPTCGAWPHGKPIERTDVSV